MAAYWKIGLRHERDAREQDNDIQNYTYAGPKGIAPFGGGAVQTGGRALRAVSVHHGPGLRREPRSRAAAGPLDAARARAQFAGGRESSTGCYRNVSPGLPLVAEPWRRLQVRASCNVSLTRPAVANLLPPPNVNEDTRLVTTGNPDLRPYPSNNFEFAVQKSFEPVGLFEVSTFLKEIFHYTWTIDTVVPGGADHGFEGPFAGFTLRRMANTGGARIRGFEVGDQQPYSFLPGFWRGFGSFADFSSTQAEGDYGSTTSQRQLASARGLLTRGSRTSAPARNSACSATGTAGAIAAARVSLRFIATLASSSTVRRSTASARGSSSTSTSCTLRTSSTRPSSAKAA